MAKSSGSCPHCCAKAKPSDIRPIVISFDGPLAPRDTSAHEQVRRELARERLERSAAEAAAAKYKLKAEDLERRLAEALKQHAVATRPAEVVWSGTKCLAWASSDSVVLGRALAHGGGFALSLVSPANPHAAQSSGALHTGVIRDLAVDGGTGRIATGSLDGTCRLLTAASLDQGLRVDVGEPVWSVALCGHVLHAGTVKGRVLSFDTRFAAAGPLVEPLLVCKGSPIHSLAAAPSTADAVLAASFSGLWRLPRGADSGGDAVKVANLDGAISSLVVGTHGALAVSVRGANASVHVGAVSAHAVWTPSMPPCVGHGNARALLSPALGHDDVVAIGLEPAPGVVAVWKALEPVPSETRLDSTSSLVTHARFAPPQAGSPSALAVLTADATLGFLNV